MKKNFIGRDALRNREPRQEKKGFGLKVTEEELSGEQAGAYAGMGKSGCGLPGTNAPYLGYPVAMALLQAGGGSARKAGGGRGAGAAAWKRKSWSSFYKRVRVQFFYSYCRGKL